jgi:hypothetical protein
VREISVVHGGVKSMLLQGKGDLLATAKCISAARQGKQECCSKRGRKETVELGLHT